MIVLRRKSAVWLTFDGAVKTTVVMTAQDSGQLIEAVSEAHGDPENDARSVTGKSGDLPARGPQTAGVLIRREQKDDVDTVQKVVGLAFARPEEEGRLPLEVGLLGELRADDGWLPALSFVAVAPADDQVIGHVVCTRGTVGTSPALGLGPLAVRPDQQGHGVGQALMHAVLGAADALGETLVALLGEPGYYQRFGFRPAARYGIAAPDPHWGDYFQVRTLSAYRPTTGTFAYAEPFTRL